MNHRCNAATAQNDDPTEESLDIMWAKITEEIALIDPESHNWKSYALPVGRVKKIMKSEDFAMQELERVQRVQAGGEIDLDRKPPNKFMVSAEAPTLMTKACELFIQEIATRAWKHTSNNRRKTLQRADIHAAVGDNEVFDFLIDIVPRVTANVVTAVSAQADGNTIAAPQADPSVARAPGDFKFNFDNIQLPANLLEGSGQPQEPSIPPLQLHEWVVDGSGIA